jgi:hypothetical protein
MYLISTSIDSIPMIIPQIAGGPSNRVRCSSPQVDVGETTAGTMAAVPWCYVTFFFMRTILDAGVEIESVSPFHPCKSIVSSLIFTLFQWTIGVFVHP